MRNEQSIWTKLLVFSMLLVFAVPLVSAEPAPSAYLEPTVTQVDCGQGTTVQVRFNTTETALGAQTHIYFNPNCVNITDVDYTGAAWQPMTGSGWSHQGDHVRTVVTNFGGVLPGDHLYATLTIECVGCDCASPIELRNVAPYECVAYNGTFTCGNPAPVVTFTKSLPEGWNLISLPLTATDNSVGAVLSGVTQNAVKRYDATTKLFEDVTTMDPGVGYFVHVTSTGPSVWSYEGTSVPSTNPGLKSGLNMIGVPNCTMMSVDTAMGSADYRYVARWNAATQEYEVYNPVAPLAFHGFTEMAAGEGYFVSAKSDCALNINCPG